MMKHFYPVLLLTKRGPAKWFDEDKSRVNYNNPPIEDLGLIC